jgi:hypothetical protein
MAAEVGDAGGPLLVGDVATRAGLGVGVFSLASGLLATARHQATRS